MSVLDRARSHHSGQAGRHVDVPEWGDKGKPLRIYFGSLSVAQRRRCWRGEDGKTLDGNLACVRAVLFQALDESGKRLFSDMDEHALTHEVDSDVVSRIGATILGFVKGAPVSATEDVDDAKNG